MRNFLTVAFIAGAALGSGCAFHEQAVVLETVGPPSCLSEDAGPKGSLVVYSAYDSDADYSELSYLRPYTNYRILSEQGKLLETVHNSNGSVVEGPRKVELPVGKYRVVARAKGYKTVTVPVVILADQVTTVHLEGSPAWPDSAALLESNPVRLPGGEIAGWRAHTETLSKP